MFTKTDDGARARNPRKSIFLLFPKVFYYFFLRLSHEAPLAVSEHDWFRFGKRFAADSPLYFRKCPTESVTFLLHRYVRTHIHPCD